MITEKILEAKKILEEYAPKGEFLAYISKEEAEILKNLGGSGTAVESTGIPSFQVTQSQVLPAPFIETLGKGYAATLPGLAGAPVTTTDISATMAQLPGETPEAFQARKTAQGIAATQFGERQAGMAALRPQVAGLDTLQTDAIAKAGGLGAYAPYLAAAGTQAGTAGTELTAAGTAMGAAPSYISGAAGLLGTGAGAAGTAGTIASYMSPYQQDVIDTALAEFDEQAARSRTQLGSPGVAGVFGGGRHGIAEAQYQSASDRNRAALQAGLSQQGYGQAAQARQQDLMNQLGLAGAQQQYGAGLAGLAGQRMGQAGFQAQLAGQAPQLAAQEISGLGTLGSVRQAQAQAELDATRQAAETAAYEPMQRAGFYGSQITGLMGGYPAQYTFQQQPQASPLSQALQAGTGLASLWGNLALARALGGA